MQPPAISALPTRRALLRRAWCKWWGKRVEIAPLHLERRIFDGGVEPLNC
jgi:hypothetical protein